MNGLKRFMLAIVFTFSVGIVASQELKAEVTNFPNGVSSFGMTVIPNVGGEVYSGNVWFVDSGDSNASDNPHEPGNRLEPFSTLDFAIGRANAVGGANNGDVIYVLPGHTESITSAGGLAFDIAGQTIICLGGGTGRPTFTLGGTNTTSVIFSAANTTLVNAFFIGGSNTAALVVSGTDVSLINCETRDGADNNATDWIVATSTARFALLNHTHLGTSTTPAEIQTGAGGTRTAFAPATFLLLSSATDTVVRGGSLYGNFDHSIIEGTWTAGAEGLSGSLRAKIYGTSGNPLIMWNENSNDVLVTMTAGSSGSVGPFLYGRVADDANNLSTATAGGVGGSSGMHFFQPIAIVNADRESSTNTTITQSTN